MLFINCLIYLLLETPDPGRHYMLPENISIENCTIFYIGCESLTLTNIIMTHNKCKVSIKKTIGFNL
jgi:diphthamide biosynthesis protein 2